MKAIILIFTCVFFLALRVESKKASPTLRDGITLEFQRLDGAKNEESTLYVYVFDSMIKIQGSINKTKKIPVVRGQSLIRKGDSLWSGARGLTINDAKFLVSLNVRLENAERAVTILAKNAAANPEFDAALRYLEYLESEVGFESDELSRTAAEIIGRRLEPIK